MAKGIPPRYDTDCEDGYVCQNGVCVKEGTYSFQRDLERIGLYADDEGRLLVTDLSAMAWYKPNVEEYEVIDGQCLPVASTSPSTTAVYLDNDRVDEPPEEPLWLESDLVPAIMANPEYYMSMVGKWDRGSICAGPK